MSRLIAAAAAWLRSTHERRAEAVRLAYRRAFADDTGQLLLDDLSQVCHAGSTTFVEGDAVTTAFREGQRSVLLHVASMLNLKASDLLAIPYRKDEESDD